MLKVPDAPVAGALKTTFVPDTGLPNASFTVTASRLAKAVFMLADCKAVPAFGAMDAADPARFVSEKDALRFPEAAVTL